MRWLYDLFDKLFGGGGSAERATYELRLPHRVATWQDLLALYTAGIGTDRLELVTADPAAAGDRVRLELALPDGTWLTETGKVIKRRRPESDQGTPVLEIELDRRSEEAQRRLSRTLATAADTRSSGPSSGTAGRKPSAIVGIDFGTTYTVVSAVRGSRIVVLSGVGGEDAFPSAVAFPTRGERIVGPTARMRLPTDPEHTVISPKRLLGRKYRDPLIQSFLGQAAYPTTEGPDGLVIASFWDEPYTLTQICSYILADAREIAERALGERVDRAVVTVPVTFEEERAKALYRAADLAGLEIVATIDEPSAAALANRFQSNPGGVVGVYDFGGGTFDFSVVDTSNSDFKVLATAGDAWLGGDDFDLVLADTVANRFWQAYQIDIRKQAVEWQRLLFACESAKRRLSREESAVIEVPEVAHTPKGVINLSVKIDRPTLERICGQVIQRSLNTCGAALSLIELSPQNLSTVYLSGGTTHMPAVQRAIAAHFGIPVRTGVPPEHAVCLGAGIHAAQLQAGRSTTLASL